MKNLLTFGLLLFLYSSLSLSTLFASWFGPDFMLKLSDDSFAIACKNSRELRFYSYPSFELRTNVPLPGVPSGVCSDPSGKTLYVTLNAPDQVLSVTTDGFKVLHTVSARSGVCAPVYDSQSECLYVCNRWQGSVSGLQAGTLQELWNSSVSRDPCSAILDPLRGVLYVPHSQGLDPANQEKVQTTITLLDVKAKGKEIKEIRMESGCADYHGMALSPDGKTVAVVHNFAKFFQGTFQVEWGWMNSSYVTFIDTEKQQVQAIIPLDDVIRGAASPWSVAWTEDGQKLLVAHAGVHELSVIDLNNILLRMAYQGKKVSYIDQHETMGMYRHRVSTGGNGPHSFIQMGSNVIVANYFTDNLGIIDLGKLPPTSPSPNPSPLKPETVELNLNYSLSLENQGEMYFSDAMLCKQNWQSCIGCHPEGRADGFNWDLMNDGIGNLKNTKSLLYSHKTPPAMVTGIRPHAEYAVRSGIRAILFTPVDENQALAMDAYLKSLRPVPSPYLVKGELSDKALAGKDLFESSEVGCIQCHFGTYYTDLGLHDVGTAVADDAPHSQWDTPTLVEVWRTAPYLHDGSASTILEVLTTRNQDQKHGHTEDLSKEELEALAEYVLSL